MAKNFVEIVVTAEDKASGVLSGIGGAVGGLGKLAGGVALAGVGALAGGFALAGSAAISMNSQLETSTLQFETLMGDAGRAEEHVRSLFDFAAATPFETGPIIEASRLMQVFGGDALNTEQNLTRIGDTAAAVGAPIESIGFWVGRAYAAIQGGQPFGEAAASLMDMGAVSPAVIEEMKALQKEGASADEVFAVLQGHMDGFTGAMEKQAGTWEGLKSTIVDNLNMAAATALEPFFELVQTGMGKLAEWLSSDEVQTAIQTIADGFATLIDQVGTFVNEQVIPFVTEHGQQLKEVLMGLAVAFGALMVIGTIVGLVSALTNPLVWVAAAIGALAVAWTTNWGGIRDKTLEAWAVIQPLLQQAWDWLKVQVPAALETLRAFWVDTAWPAIQSTLTTVWSVVQPVLLAVWEWLKVNVPAALEALRTFWVDTAWPAIQTAIETVWPIIEEIFATLKDWFLNELIPAVQELWEQWTTVWWPEIQTALENTWTIIEEILGELWRWFNDNIIPIVKELWEQWTTVWWPEIEKALKSAWDEIKPVLQWLWDKFVEVMGGIKGAIQPALDLWDTFVGAVERFWDWISSKTFEFKISIPDLPDWAIPGSPLPIHTAWKAFGKDMKQIQANIGAGTGAIGGQLTGGAVMPAVAGVSKSTVVNIDARGAQRGVDRDLRVMIEQVLREQGSRADLRIRTS